MPDAGFDIRPFDRGAATDADFAASNAFDNITRAESWPDDPPTPLEETKLNYRELPSYIDQRTWFAWREGAIVASGGVSLQRTPQNRHAAWAHVGVDPSWRRRGLGTALLRLVVEASRSEGRRLLFGSTTSRAPDGEAFMRALGATPAQAVYTNQLNIDEVNREALADWLALAPALDKDFEMELVEGAMPEDQLESIAALMDVMNTAPRDDLEVEDSPMTPERLRELEAYERAANWARWTMYVRHRDSGRLAGYTEVLYRPGLPYELNQGDTGVFPEFRNRGLGKWLKASMLDKVLRERPEVRFIRTGNAQSNAPMLRINNELGFKPYLSRMNWQVPLDKVEVWLASRPSAPSVTLPGGA
jgi:GNAT superfamily N-acetyltransferase